MTFLRITKVTSESWTEEVPVSNPDYEVQTVSLFRGLVWLEVEGGVYVRELKEGENLETVASDYRKSGMTDDSCIPFA